jgi:histidinol-phosphate aminotransferase
VAGFEALLVPAAQRLTSPSAYLAHLDAAAADPTLLRLGSNENAEPPSPRVRAALEEVYAEANRYPATVPPLRTALAGRFGVGTDRVIVGAGSTEVIDATLRAFVRSGDEVVLPTPSWPVLRGRLQALEASIVDVPLSDDGSSFAYDAAAMHEAVSPRTKLVVVCTPNNPTGNSMPLDGLRLLATAGPMLLVDAAYADFDAEVDVSPLVHESDRVVVTRTFSKAHALAGLRVGYAVGDARVLDYVSRFLVPGSSVSVAALGAGIASLEDEDYTRRQVERVRTERARLVTELRARGLRAFDSRGNFVAVDPAPATPRAFVQAVLERGVVIRAMDDRLARITVGTREQNDVLLSALDGISHLGPA